MGNLFYILFRPKSETKGYVMVYSGRQAEMVLIVRCKKALRL